MFLRRAVAVAFWVLLTSLPSWARVGVSYFEIPPKAEGEPSYIVGLIRGRPDNSKSNSPENEAEALKLAQATRGWAFQRFREAPLYKSYTEEQWQKLEASDLVMDERMTRIVVMKNDGSKEIVGTLKLVYDQEGKELPLDPLFHPHSYPRPKPRMEPIASLTSFGNFSVWNQIGGGTVQVMEFIGTPGTDVPPILHYFAMVDDAFNFDGSMRAKAPEVDMPPEIVARGMHHEGRLRPAFSEYVLYCDGGMLPYYKKLGFEQVGDGPIKENLHVMRMGRDSFIKIGLESWRGRPGFKQISGAKIQVTNERGRSSQPIIGYIPGPHSKEDFAALRTRILTKIKNNENVSNEVLNLYFVREKPEVQRLLTELIEPEFIHGTENEGLQLDAFTIIGHIEHPLPEVVDGLKKAILSPRPLPWGSSVRSYPNKTDLSPSQLHWSESTSAHAVDALIYLLPWDRSINHFLVQLLKTGNSPSHIGAALKRHGIDPETAAELIALYREPGQTELRKEAILVALQATNVRSPELLSLLEHVPHESIRLRQLAEDILDFIHTCLARALREQAARLHHNPSTPNP